MRQWLWGIMLLACLGSATGAERPADGEIRGQAEFSAATRAFRAGDFAAALAGYQAALAAGLDGPAVHFNIGVCAWELDRLDEAEQAFLAASEYPQMAGIAYYNLGLVSQRRGDHDAALAWFRRAGTARADDALQGLVAAQLRAYGAEQSAPETPELRPVVFLSVLAGHDDNVALIADGELIGISGTESAFVDAQLAAAMPLAAGLRLEGGAFLLRYADLAEYNQSGGQAALVLRHALAGWNGEIGAGYALDQLDGERFEDRLSVSLGASRRLDPAWDVRLRYRFEDIDARDPFAALTGERHEASVRLRRRGDASWVRLEYRLESNDREDDAVSPDRHQFDAEWAADVSGTIQAVLGLGWRHSRYALADGPQSERRTTASAGLVGPLAGPWRWTASYDWTRNSASDDLFDYTRQRLFAGIEAVF